MKWRILIALQPFYLLSIRIPLWLFTGASARAIGRNREREREEDGRKGEILISMR